MPKATGRVTAEREYRGKRYAIRMSNTSGGWETKMSEV